MIEVVRSWLGDEPDEFALLRVKPNREVVERVDEPLDAEAAAFQFDLPDGKYQLRAVRGGRFEEQVWATEIGDADRADEIAELRRELRALRREQGEQSGEPKRQLTPGEAVEQQRAKLALAALNSEEFIQRHGEKIALSMFEDSPNGVEFEDFERNPIGAAIWELKQDPAKLGDFGGALGDLLDGAAGTDWSSEPDSEGAESGGGEGFDLDGVDAGPTTLKDLEAAAQADEPEPDQATLDEADQEGEPDEPDRSDAEAVAAEMTDEREAAMADGGEPDPAEVADEL